MTILEKQSRAYSSRQAVFNSKLKDLLLEIRPHQWVKNIFLAAGLVFSGNFTNLHMLIKVFSAISVFCLLSGSAYIINDIIDLEKDRRHPQKAYRPLASGRISIAAAYVYALLMVVLAGAGMILFSLGLRFALTAACYYLLTVLYSITLKNIIFVDILTIAGGFVLRVIAGCVLVAPDISPWIVICSLLLALFLALCKRRHELQLLGERSGFKDVQHRDVGSADIRHYVHHNYGLFALYILYGTQSYAYVDYTLCNLRSFQIPLFDA